MNFAFGTLGMQADAAAGGPRRLQIKVLQGRNLAIKDITGAPLRRGAAPSAHPHPQARVIRTVL